jgi:hypothetical protein
MSKSQRDKGKRGELEAVRQLRRVFPDAARRILNDAANETGVDLKGTGRLLIQVKNHRRYVPCSTLKEIREVGGIPVVMTKADHKPWLVVMKLDDLLKILEDVGVAYADGTAGL